MSIKTSEDAVLQVLKRMKGLEPSTFCMASRRSSQLSYIRVVAQYSHASAGRPWPCGWSRSGLLDAVQGFVHEAVG